MVKKRQGLVVNRVLEQDDGCYWVCSSTVLLVSFRFVSQEMAHISINRTPEAEFDTTDHL